MIRNMNVIRETLKKLLFFMILTLGTTVAWGQDYSGVYYIANDNSTNGHPEPVYNVGNSAINY